MAPPIVRSSSYAIGPFSKFGRCSRHRDNPIVHPPIQQKDPCPNCLGQESFTPAVPPEFIRLRQMHFLCAPMMHTSMITGEVPVAPNGGVPPSDCPRKSIQRSRRCRNPTICGSLGTPDAPSTTLTHRFYCSVVVIYIMPKKIICQVFFSHPPLGPRMEPAPPLRGKSGGLILRRYPCPFSSPARSRQFPV